jgi:alkaline phosphatase D
MEELFLDRRRFLIAAGGLATLAAAAQVPGAASASAATSRPGPGYPFTLGVASGDPTPFGVVLWTRLAPEPLTPGGGMPARRANVQWQVAKDEGMRQVVASGVAQALPQLAHAVHVEVEGLEPGREYHYRFRSGSEISPVGRTRTTPRARDRVDQLSFAFASCQKWEDGFFAPYRHMAQDDLDLVLHVGDYVYEYAIKPGSGPRRPALPAEVSRAPRSLEDWRMRYALYKSDPDLQRAHQRFPWVVTWDDHEVQNDYAATRSQYEPDLSALRAAAYQAWYEHQPVRRRQGRSGAPQIYQRLKWGSLAQFDVLDGRQYRDAPPCGWGEAQACDEASDPRISMLGAEQERWLMDGLSASTAGWNVLANNVMMGRLDHDGDKGDLLWHDAWDGFPAARNRITDRFVQAGVRNPVILTGDWHSTFVNDIHRDFDQPGSPVVATEFVGSSVSSNGDRQVYGPYYGPMIQHNPHIRFFDGDRRGYVRCRLDGQQWRTDLQMVTTVSRADAPAYTLASFTVEDGRPGAQRL